MGETYATVTIRNPADRERAWESEFLVDTGAHDTIVPRKHLEAVGLKPEGSREYELADGAIVDFEVGGATLGFLGRSTHTDVLFGDDDAEPLLGVIALQAVGAEVDLRNERLTLKPVLRLPTLLLPRDRRRRRG
ncbi:MAG: clan AA aspartic protease [Acidimicrobiaceae bacterium]|nr:clan AA aspartic protease [Acidimicrobiaceae bacterium]